MNRYLALFLLASSASAVTVQFDPLNPQTGPFPADSLTVPDTTQITGKHVNLPLPDCNAQPGLCSMLALENQQDGFNVQPRITASFSGPIDTSTLQTGIFFVALDNLTSDEAGLEKPGDTVAINQIAWDPASNTAYAKPDAAMDQHRRYLLVVTDAVHDAGGNPVTPDPAFTACLQTSDTTGYCPDLSRAVAQLIPGANKIVAASLFTTLSATAWVQSARRQLQYMPVVTHHPDGQYVFNFSTLSNLAVNFDTGSGNFTGFSLPLNSPTYSLLFGGLGRIAFGSYLSPLVLNSQLTIDPSPTGAEVALPTPLNEINFHVYLPNTPPPSNGYPVVIFGHGFGDSSIGAPTVVAPALANAGFATIAINAFGHGFGPQSNLVLTDSSGNSTTIPLGGRGVNLAGQGMIGPTDGCVILSPVPVGLRDCLRQTVVDLLQLVRVIQGGLDLDGDGVPDLDGTRIYYVGQSYGAIYGTVLNAVEPGIRAAVLNVGGGSVADIERWSPGFSDTAAATLTSQNPPLLPAGT
ncbi:MAG TPA: Ig-like domain-containing protein, partial [Bryobacteraceae bacterium]